jgi:hypothetical protein
MTTAYRHHFWPSLTDEDACRYCAGVAENLVHNVPIDPVDEPEYAEHDGGDQ